MIGENLALGIAWILRASIVFMPSVLVAISESGAVSNFRAAIERQAQVNLSLELTMECHTMRPGERPPDIKLSIVNRGDAPVFITQPNPTYSGLPGYLPRVGLSVIRSNIHDPKKEHPQSPRRMIPCIYGEPGPTPLPLVEIGAGRSHDITFPQFALPNRGNFALPGRYRIVFYYSNLPAGSWSSNFDSYRKSTPCRLRSDEVELLVVE